MGEARTYAPAERERIIAKIRAGLKDGKRVAVSAAELGIGEATFYRWVREKARADKPGSRGRTGYAPEQRASILAAVRQRMAGGLGLDAACRAEGITSSSYYNWAADERRRAPVAMTLRPVSLVPTAGPTIASPAPAARELTLLSPGGYRVEGLDVAAAAALLKALT